MIENKPILGGVENQEWELIGFDPETGEVSFKYVMVVKYKL